MRRLVTVGALLVTLTGCGQVSTTGSGGPGRDATDRSVGGGAADGSVGGGAADGEVSVTAKVSVGFSQHPADPGVRRRPGIVVDYEVANAGTRQLVVYDRVPDTLGSATLPADLSPEHVWVYLAGGVVRLSKQGFASAPGVRFVAAPVIGVRALAPGATITGRAYAVSPPALDVPGPDFEAPRAPVDPEATHLQFCVQVGERTAAMRPSSAGQDVLAAPVTAPGPDGLHCVGPLPLVSP